MNEQQKRKGDFMPKYSNAQAIIDNDELQPAEQICEFVKHYSMCLFGIATDISDYYGKLAERDKQIDDLQKENRQLLNKNAKLLLQIKTQDKQPQEILDELVKIKSEHCRLKGVLARYRTKCHKLLSDTAIVELKQKLYKQQQDVHHWRERAEQLEALNKTLQERRNNGK